MEICIEKYAMLIIRSGKRQIKEGIELPDQERNRTPQEQENDKYLSILETDPIKQAEKKENITKGYLRRTKNFLEIKLYSSTKG